MLTRLLYRALRPSLSDAWREGSAAMEAYRDLLDANCEPEYPSNPYRRASASKETS